MSALGLADARTYLKISDNTLNAELQDTIDDAESILAQRVGPLSLVEITARVPGYGWSLHLPTFPAVELTSVSTAGGSALTLADLYLEQRTGDVSYTGGAFFASAGYDVVYTAGHSPLPADLRRAIKRLVRALWNDQRGGGTRPGANPEAPISPSLLPAVVEQLIQPYDIRPLGV